MLFKSFCLALMLGACGPTPLAKAWVRNQPTAEEQAAGVSMVNKVLNLSDSGVLTLDASLSFSPSSANADCTVNESGAGTFTSANSQVTFTYTMYSRIVSGCSDPKLDLVTTAVPGTDSAAYIVTNDLTLSRELTPEQSPAPATDATTVKNPTEIYTPAAH